MTTANKPLVPGDSITLLQTATVNSALARKGAAFVVVKTVSDPAKQIAPGEAQALFELGRVERSKPAKPA